VAARARNRLVAPGQHKGCLRMFPYGICRRTETFLGVARRTIVFVRPRKDAGVRVLMTIGAVLKAHEQRASAGRRFR
jgi:hypothetical protein